MSTWSWQDELQRLALTYMQNPPTSITELFDSFEQATKPKTRARTSSFSDVVDDPCTTQPEEQEDETVARTRMTRPTHLYTCPVCGASVYGLIYLEPKLEQPDDDVVGSGMTSVNVLMDIVGMKSEKHDCVPNVKR